MWWYNIRSQHISTLVPKILSRPGLYWTWGTLWWAENFYRQHNGSHYCCHFGGRQMYGIWWHGYEIQNTKIICSLCLNRGVRKNNGHCPLHNNTRLYIAETIKSIFTHYKRAATPLPNYSPDFQLFPKLKEPLCGQWVQSLGTLNVAVTQCVRQLNSSRQLNDIQGGAKRTHVFEMGSSRESFFLWGYLKSKVYVRKSRTVDDLKVSIRE